MCLPPWGQEWEGDWRLVPRHGFWGPLLAWGGGGWAGRLMLACIVVLKPQPRGKHSWCWEVLLGALCRHSGPPMRTCDQEKGGDVHRSAHLGSMEAVPVTHVSLWVWSTDLGILLGMALGNKGLEVWPVTSSEECAITGFLRDKLQYRNRLQYMVTLWAPLCPSSQDT